MPGEGENRSSSFFLPFFFLFLQELLGMNLWGRRSNFQKKMRVLREVGGGAGGEEGGAAGRGTVERQRGQPGLERETST